MNKYALKSIIVEVYMTILVKLFLIVYGSWLIIYMKATDLQIINYDNILTSVLISI